MSVDETSVEVEEVDLELLGRLEADIAKVQQTLAALDAVPPATSAETDQAAAIGRIVDDLGLEDEAAPPAPSAQT